MKLNIDADSKKLSNNIPFTDRDLPHISQEVTIKKKVILKAEKEYERNEEKIN